MKSHRSCRIISIFAQYCSLKALQGGWSIARKEDVKNVSSVLEKAKFRPTHRLGASLTAKMPLNMKHIETCMPVFFLAEVYHRTDGEMLSCEVHFVRCGFYYVAQTKRNTTKRYDAAFTERFLFR